MASLYILAGINHFVMPRMYQKIIPPILPWKPFINYASGVAEIVLGVFLMIEDYRQLAAWGIIILLILVFPANIYHYMASKPGRGIPRWVLLLRLPLQGVLIYWAWLYT